MTEEKRHQLGDVLKAVMGVLMGAILTLLFTAVNKTQDNSERIARLEAIVEPLRFLPADVASLKTTAERNVVALDRIEKKIDAHTERDPR